MSATVPEPTPQQNDNTAIWTLVLEDVPHVFPRADQGEVVAGLRADMHARDDMGRAKYSTPLQAHNGRNPWVDAYQEALDGCAYSMQMKEEAATEEERNEAFTVYRSFLVLAFRLKRAAMIREGWTP
jgi:hypothetical protein